MSQDKYEWNEEQRESVAACLKVFEGMSADEVAAFLEREGIKGVRCSTAHCPIAEHIRKQTGIDCLAVTRHDVSDLSSLLDPNTVRNPQGVNDFIRSIDDGLYQNLVINKQN